MQPDEWAVWIKMTGYAVFAAIGGIMGHVMRIIDKEERLSWGRAAIEGAAAGFVGLLFVLICQEFNLSDQWTGVIVGVAGWLGANASIRLLENIVRKKLGIDKTGESDADSPSS